jgi:hypothetical protein
MAIKIDGINIDRASVQGLLNNIGNVEEKIKKALLLITETVALKMEAWAKDNAEWTDRTGDARKWLKGTAHWENASELVASISHTMEYGVWLELAHDRKFAILERAIDQYKDELFKAWKTIVGGS